MLVIVGYQFAVFNDLHREHFVTEPFWQASAFACFLPLLGCLRHAVGFRQQRGIPSR